MNRDETVAVLRYLGAAYPRDRWDEDTVRLWQTELEPYPARQAMAAAREMARTSEFASIAAFTRAVASVRERVADTHHDIPADFDRPALQAGVEPEPDPEIRARYLAEIRESLLRQKARSRAALADTRNRVLADPLRARIPRPDENYFYPPEEER